MPIVVLPLKIVKLDKKKDVYYEVLLDLCDYCNGPVITVRKLDRQFSMPLHLENDQDALDKMEFYTRNKDEEEDTKSWS